VPVEGRFAENDKSKLGCALAKYALHSDTAFIGCASAKADNHFSTHQCGAHVLRREDLLFSFFGCVST